MRFMIFDSDEDEDGNPSPVASPRKSPTKSNTSPVKKDKAVIEARKAFEVRKTQMAIEFLAQLDERITSGKIAELAASTGGVKIVWSKKLNSTAGRANWRRERIKMASEHSDGERKEHKHYASIELAEKVINDEHRLINVLAHEFCHLANFMISDVKGNPHGKEFKEWAKKCMRVFGNRGVEVTTKHSYEIDYKFVWECVTCGMEFKRHSKSVNVERHSCGACKGKLVQTKPPVRSTKKSDYQVFVKENFAKVKGENPESSHGVVMGILGKMYQEQKKSANTVKMGEKEMESLTKTLEIITLDD
jgi:predicted SprT family Zn-dependent metalloprotease